jgi:cytochrome c oxidase subunit 2
MPAFVRRKTTTLLVLLAAALAVASVALAGDGNGGLTPQSSDSPNAVGIRHSYLLIGVITGAIFVLVEGLLIAFVLGFRRRGRTRLDDGPQIHGSTRLELAWTVAPAVLLAIVAGFVLATLPGISDVPKADAAGGRLDVAVSGRQFYWQFTYPNGALSFDELVVPVGRNVKLTVTAPEHDVIHSWWVPKLGGKIDAIPGRVNETWFRAPAKTTYRGQCAELCGVQHARMTNEVRAVDQGAYRTFVEKQKRLLDSGSAELGKQQWDAVCAKCHRLSGEKLIGPNLGGNPRLSDAESLGQLVRNGFLTMPAVGADWSDRQVEALVAYAKTLGAGGSSGGQG